MKKCLSPLVLFSLTLSLVFASCSKSSTETSALYTPTSANVTATATLQELQQGRVLFINNCGKCHAYVSPDTYTPAQWRTILPTMTPRTQLSPSDVALLTKYVCKGN